MCPLAGSLAGLVVSAVVALPVLVASTAYVIGAHLAGAGACHRLSVSRAGSTWSWPHPIGLAVVVALAGVPVFAMLVAASVIGGLGTPVGLVILVRLARDRQIMGSRPVSVPLAAAGWGVAAVASGLGVLLIVWAALAGF